MGKPSALCSSGKVIAWHAAKRPERAERRIAGGIQPFRRGAWRRRRDDRVVALLEKLDETVMHRRNLSERVLIIRRAHFAAALDLRAQLFG